MTLKIKEQDLMGIIESLSKACTDGTITDTLWVTPYQCETVVELVYHLLGFEYTFEYDVYKKLVLENNRNMYIEVEEKDLICILDSINEGCNNGVIVDTLFYNNSIGEPTLYEFICCNLLRVPLEEIDSYKRILEYRNKLEEKKGKE